MFGPQTSTLATVLSPPIGQCIADFMHGFSVETTPRAGAGIPDYREYLRPGTTVYIAHLPRDDFGDVMRGDSGTKASTPSLISLRGVFRASLLWKRA
jgi:hypothetical protein